MKKTIKSIVRLEKRFNGNGFTSTDLRGGVLDIDPYLVITEFNMSQPFFPPHPHAGVSVLTYIFPDSAGAFINRDSHGDNSKIAQGGMHLTQAGVGMQHEEIPEIPGVNVHGMQIWINHSADNRLSEAKSYHANSADIQEINDENAKIRIIFGEQTGKHASIKPLTPVTLLDVYVQPNAEVNVQLPEGQQGVVMVLAGDGVLNETISVKALNGTNLSANGNELTAKAGANGLHFLVTAGKPLQEPIVYGGPFVMNTADQLLETKRRFARGEMGVLEPSVKF
jgi:redox-sensitive bicupin YhaK (pirin superfamily)